MNNTHKQFLLLKDLRSSLSTEVQLDRVSWELAATPTVNQVVDSKLPKPAQHCLFLRVHKGEEKFDKLPWNKRIQERQMLFLSSLLTSLVSVSWREHESQFLAYSHLTDLVGSDDFSPGGARLWDRAGLAGRAGQELQQKLGPVGTFLRVTFISAELLVKTCGYSRVILVLLTVPVPLVLQNALSSLLKPISEQIQVVQDFREKNRGSKMFNHLSAVSESIPALGWVAMVRTSVGRGFLGLVGQVCFPGQQLHTDVFFLL